MENFIMDNNPLAQVVVAKRSETISLFGEYEEDREDIQQEKECEIKLNALRPVNNYEPPGSSPLIYGF